MGRLEVRQGCQVQLRDGQTVGPITSTNRRFKPWQCDDLKWYHDGSFGLFPNHPFDIVRVVDRIQIESDQLILVSPPCEAFAKRLPPHVLKAAQEAGLKARPAYEEFVQAIVSAAFTAAEVQPIDISRVRPGSIDGLALQAAIEKRMQDTTPFVKDICRTAARVGLDVLMEALDSARTRSRNESETEIRPSENSKGGQSDQVQGADLSPIDESGFGSGFEVAPPASFFSLETMDQPTRAFLQAIYPQAPLRAVEMFDERHIRADYGTPMNTVATITVKVWSPGSLPDWRV